MHPAQTLLRLSLVSTLALAATACTTIPSFSQPEYVSPIDGASVQENTTRYSKPLECLRPLVSSKGPAAKRYAVGKVLDFSGKEDLTNGKRITQGAALMVISALSRTGVPMVERFDTSIADMELKYADNKLITDNTETREHRRIFSGSLPGSDYHIVGGVTEVNYNIRSGSFESTLRFVGMGARYFVMNVAVDLRLVNTKTLEIVNTQSLQKQIIGTELNGGYFRLFSDGLVDINAAERTQEPIQKGVRMVLEQAVFNMIAESNKLPAQHCMRMLNPANEQAKASSATAATSNATARTSTAAQPPVAPAPAIAASPARTAPSSGGTESVMIDPATGEPVPLGEFPKLTGNTPPAKGEEVQQLNGLFNTGANPEAPGGNASNRAMQEKMLYGNRPVLR